MSSILNRQKQLADQSRLIRERSRQDAERARKQLIEERPPKVPAGPLEDVRNGIAMNRSRIPVKIGSRRKRIAGRKTIRNQRNGQRSSSNKARK